jgi:hypothetical protein
MSEKGFTTATGAYFSAWSRCVSEEQSFFQTNLSLQHLLAPPNYDHTS